MRNTKMYNLFLISLVALVYLSVTLGLYFFQRSLLYHPTENNYSGDKILVDVEKIKVTTQDNIQLVAWYHKKNLNNYKTILFLHGNAGSLENRIHKINHFKDIYINFLIIDCEVLAVIMVNLRNKVFMKMGKALLIGCLKKE